MARHKIPPVAPSPTISDAMRRASTQISPPTAETLFGEHSISAKNNKASSKSRTPTLRSSQNRATSEPAIAKRKAATLPGENSVPAGIDLIQRTSVTPRRSTRARSTDVNQGLAVEGSFKPPAKRLKTQQDPSSTRRSSRMNGAAGATGLTSSNSSRSSRNIKRTIRSSVAKDTESTPSSPGSNGSEGVSSAPTSVSGAIVTATDENGTSNLNSGTYEPPPASDMRFQPTFTQAQSLGTYDYPQLLPMNFSATNAYAPMPETVSGPSDAVFMMPFQPHTNYPPICPQYEFSHLPQAVGANMEELNMETTSRRGQKVKGRPLSKKAPAPTITDDVSGDAANDTASKARSSGNTHPRKQPFKSQVTYSGYPDPEAQIPQHYTLFDICQKMPNSLREGNLRPFIQWEWSANELFTCLPADVQETLKARPGKDKTMIYQKRLERMRKDLDAKGELNDLLSAPKERADGRPPHIKRGNIRRN